MQINDSSFGTKPPAERVFTTEDIALLSGYSKEGVRGIMAKLGFKASYRPTNVSREGIWDYVAYKEFMEWANYQKDRREKLETKKAEPSKTLEQLKAEHPLVKDINCFRLSWWPDIVPDCFKELDND